MSKGAIENAGLSYRKGVVLGLTMAEIILLVTFLVLMVLASLLLDKEKEVEKVKEDLASAQTILAQIDQDFDTQDFIELTNNYQQTRIRNGELESRLREKSEQLSKAEQTIEALQPVAEIKKEMNLDDNEFQELVREAQSIREEMQKQDSSKSRDQLAIENKRLREQKGHLERQVASLGGSGDPVQCWYHPKTGKSEYIFDITLLDDGFVIKDNAIPHRAEEQAQLPIEMIEFGRKLTPQEFGQQAQPLYLWSREEECRFVIRLIDQVTGTKDLFKRRERQLEGFFYKFEVN